MSSPEEEAGLIGWELMAMTNVAHRLRTDRTLRDDAVAQTAFMESYLVHVRILTEFFMGRIATRKTAHGNSERTSFRTIFFRRGCHPLSPQPRYSIGRCRRSTPFCRTFPDGASTTRRLGALPVSRMPSSR